MAADGQGVGGADVAAGGFGVSLGFAAPACNQVRGLAADSLGWCGLCRCFPRPPRSFSPSARVRMSSG